MTNCRKIEPLEGSPLYGPIIEVESIYVDVSAHGDNGETESIYAETAFRRPPLPGTKATGGVTTVKIPKLRRNVKFGNYAPFPTEYRGWVAMAQA